jgi:hypothetical protein
MEYIEAKIIHSQNIYEQFNEDPTYLFLNQFMKNGNKELQTAFLEFLNFQPNGKRIDEKFKETYDFVKANSLLQSIKDFILQNRQNAVWYSSSETQTLLEELHDIPLSQDEFSPANSIDKQLFSKIHNISNITELENVIATMEEMLKKKIYWTYYNTQTTRIIEDIFSIHPNVIPTLVDIKGVDFFIDDLPIDLKITRLPKGFDENFDKDKLIKWFYENQSEQRFGAENRLFLVLNNINTPENTDWLKITHYDKIKNIINQYLDDFTSQRMDNISFSFAGKTYNVKSDLIFINV